MNKTSSQSAASENGQRQGRYEYFDLKPPRADMAAEVIQGLSQPQKTVSPKFFYNEEGSELFVAITQLPEYYLTRTELGLFDSHRQTIHDAVDENACLVEYGSGSSLKIRKLLETIRPQAYMPVDISGDHLQAHAKALFADHPWLDVLPICADFTASLDLPDVVADLPKVGFFPGSSIGNFSPEAAQTFLGEVAHTLGVNGELIIGVDRKKDHAVLEAAYNDNRGVTAAFNLNALTHVNAELGADFDLGAFDHTAEYDEAAGCIRMYLISDREQDVHLGKHTFHFARGERLHTENSFKYHPQEFLDLAARAGFAERVQVTDDQERFSLFVLRVVSARD